jgi:hypothetical protein
MAKKQFDNKGFRLKCPTCKDYFIICYRCYRGHRYCSKSCSQDARKKSQAFADKRYRRSSAGKRKRQLSQNRYRKKLKNVNDHTSRQSHKNLRRRSIVLERDQNNITQGRCIKCGCMVPYIILGTPPTSVRRRNFGNQYRSKSSHQKNVLCRAPPD